MSYLLRGGSFPWGSIWKVKSPFERFFFFVWTAALGKILTLYNMRKSRIIVVELCCMCRRTGESIDNLFSPL
jgi:hypothetical protein